MKKQNLNLEKLSTEQFKRLNRSEMFDVFGGEPCIKSLQGYHTYFKGFYGDQSIDSVGEMVPDASGGGGSWNYPKVERTFHFFTDINWG